MFIRIALTDIATHDAIQPAYKLQEQVTMSYVILSIDKETRYTRTSDKMLLRGNILLKEHDLAVL